MNTRRKLLPKIILGALLILSFLLMWTASLGDSGTMDELAHIPAGYSYVRYLDYRLNPEHPPLIKDLAGLPLLLFNLNFPLDHKSFQQDINGQWDMGRAFLYDSGNDPDRIIQWARLGPMLLTLLFILVTYVWASELLGRWWGLIPASFVALSPNILAHGHYVTTDIAAAFGIMVGMYYFIKYLLHPSKKHFWFAGIAFGIAQLLKFSSVLLVVHFFLVLIAWWIIHIIKEWNAVEKKERVPHFLGRSLRQLGATLLIFIVGIVFVVWPVYYAHTINYPPAKQRSDTEFILSSFAGGPDAEWDACNPLSPEEPLWRLKRCPANLTVWMSDKPVLRSLAHYALGVLMVIQRASGGNTTYFLGEVSASGWWYYFPVVFFIKEPLSSLLFIFIALGILAFWWIRHDRTARNKPRSIAHSCATFIDLIQKNFALFAMALFIFLYWFQSIRSNLNIGVRHILPTLPFIYILVFAVFKRWVGPLTPRTLYGAAIKMSVILLGVFAYYGSAFSAAPYFLSYFNALGGGVMNGHSFVVDSNYDWGQDLKRLRNWVNERNTDQDPTNDIEKIAIDYFGAGNPTHYLEGLAEPWWSSRGNPQNQDIRWFAVSATFLHGAKGIPAPGYVRNPQDEYPWLINYERPYARAGTSIFIYRLP